ncbi:MAG: SipW-dependent-type signal peptide-containing protein [Christensenellales bacterium]
MKRKLLILSVLAICIATLAAGTLAYFTAEGKAHNVITTGGVEIALQEWADEGKTTPFENLTGVMPNTAVTKIAEVKNTGAAPAWVRVKVEKAIKLAKDIEGFTPDMALVELNLNTDKWTQGTDGYLYYKEALQPNEVTAPIFTAVTFKPEMGNEYQSATATVDVMAQAVQTANNGDTVTDAKGWPAA